MFGRIEGDEDIFNRGCLEVFGDVRWYFNGITPSMITLDASGNQLDVLEDWFCLANTRNLTEMPCLFSLTLLLPSTCCNERRCHDIRVSSFQARESLFLVRSSLDARLITWYLGTLQNVSLITCACDSSDWFTIPGEKTQRHRAKRPCID